MALRGSAVFYLEARAAGTGVAGGVHFIACWVWVVRGLRVAFGGVKMFAMWVTCAQ
jgi:hypothetical protein